MQVLLALFLLMHAIAHLVGFVGPFGLLGGRVPAHVAVLDGRVEISSALGRLLGLAWLATALGFAVASFALWARVSWWLPYTAVVAAISLGLSALCWPESKLGVPVNLSLLVLLLGMAHAGALSEYN